MQTLDVKNLDFFKQSGYLLLKNFFPATVIKDAGNWLRSQNLSTFARSWTDQEPGVELAVLQNIHTSDTPLAKIASDSTMLKIAAELMGDDVYIWSSKVNLKAAWCGTVEYFHQDYAYWRHRGYNNSEMMTCMTFIDRHSPANGGLQLFPGSHRSGYIEHEDFININGLSKFMVPPARLDSLNATHGIDAIVAEPGDILFFHADLVHGSSHNLSPKSRMTILSQLNTEKNLPQDSILKAKAFNLQRVSKELKEAERRLDWFRRKHNAQYESNEIVFNSPIPHQEKNR